MADCNGVLPAEPCPALVETKARSRVDGSDEAGAMWLAFIAARTTQSVLFAHR